MYKELLSLIDESLDLYKDRGVVTHTEFQDTLLDLRLILMKGEEDGSLSLEDDALVGVGDIGIR